MISVAYAVQSRQTKENEGSRKGSNGDRIPRLPHDGINEGNSDTAHDGAKAPHSNERHIGLGIVVPNVSKGKNPIESKEPRCPRVQHLRQRRVDIEIVFSTDVVTGERSKVDFVENDLVGMGDSPKTDNEGEKCEA
jgi:hypothetical protein